MSILNELPEGLIEKISTETGLSAEELSSKKEFLIALTLSKLIEKSECVLAYMGPDKFKECLASSIILSSIMNDDNLSEEAKEEKAENVREMIAFAVDNYYEKVITTKISQFMDTIAVKE